MRDSLTGSGISNVEVESIDGANAGRGTKTGNDGVYRIEQLTAGSMQVRASVTGYLSAATGIALTADQTLNFTLTPTNIPPPPSTSYRYFGTVRDSNGSPVPNVDVYWRLSESVPFDRIRTDVNGAWSFTTTARSMNVYFQPPSGYERRYVYSQDQNRAYFMPSPGEYNVRLRHVMGIVLLNVPPTIRVDGIPHTVQSFNMMCRATLDNGEVIDTLQNPAWSENRFLESTNKSILWILGLYDQIQGLSSGNAQLRCALWFINSDWVPIQVVP